LRAGVGVVIMEVPSDAHIGMLLYLTAAGLVVLIPQLPAAAERATGKERAVVAGTHKERAIVAVRGLAGMYVDWFYLVHIC